MSDMRICLVVAAVLSIMCAPAGAVQADLDILYRECGPQLKLSDKGCRCISDSAAKQLNDKQQAYVAAAVARNRARAETLHGQMTLDELTQAGKFMARAPQVCAGG